MSDISNELLPCPFCGAAPKVRNTGEGAYAIECGAAPCKGSGIITAFFERGGDIQKATEAWNTRAPSDNASELSKDDLLKNIESALELGNNSHCFISTSTLCQAQNEIVDLRYQLAALPSTESVSISKEDADTFLQMVIEPLNQCQEMYNMANAGSPLAKQSKETLAFWKGLEARVKTALEAANE
tara:strand:- start:18815 stop:19369 length:555 start_codon:yes stop_codon:yes gene_type:complete